MRSLQTYISISIQANTLRVIAGPCAVEGHEQLMATAKAIKQAGFGY